MYKAIPKVTIENEIFVAKQISINQVGNGTKISINIPNTAPPTIISLTR